MDKVNKMMVVKFQPTEGMVVMRTVVQDTGSKIIGSEKATDEDSTQRGLIFASGSELYEKGDIVIYNKYAALPLKLDQGAFLISSIEAILGKITE
jgi:co-chaperonin GroES (HSP10)